MPKVDGAIFVVERELDEIRRAIAKALADGHSARLERDFSGFTVAVLKFQRALARYEDYANRQRSGR